MVYTERNPLPFLSNVYINDLSTGLTKHKIGCNFNGILNTVVKKSSHSYLRLIVLDFIVVHCGANINVKLIAKKKFHPIISSEYSWITVN